MMFYVYTELIPLVIAIILWFLIKPQAARTYVDYTLLLIAILFFYTLIPYVCDTNSYISEGWMTSPTIVCFLVPTLIIVLLIKTVMCSKKCEYYIRESNKHKKLGF